MNDFSREPLHKDVFAHEGQQDYYAISKIRWSPDGTLAWADTASPAHTF
ncbi:hypothetical protein NST99_21445 [Paenibacillus sp. FSL L8-0470]